jgi:hypothetical protein
MNTCGLTQADTVTEKIATRRLSCVEAIRERRGEVTCFTPALLITCGRLPVDPINEFVARFNVADEQRPFCVEVPPPLLPFFSGLGVTSHAGSVVDWDRRLYAVPNQVVKDCFNFLGGIGITSADFMASSVMYEIDIPDPTMPQFDSRRHVIPVTVFGVLSADKITYLEPNGALPPFLKTVPAQTALNSSKFQPGLDAASLKKIQEEL